MFCLKIQHIQTHRSPLAYCNCHPHDRTFHPSWQWCYMTSHEHKSNYGIHWKHTNFQQLITLWASLSGEYNVEERIQGASRQFPEFGSTFLNGTFHLSCKSSKKSYWRKGQTSKNHIIMSLWKKIINAECRAQVTSVVTTLHRFRRPLLWLHQIWKLVKDFRTLQHASRFYLAWG